MCPVCGQEKSITIWSRPDFELYHYPYLKGNPAGSYRMDLVLKLCTACHHAFLDPRPSDEVLSHFYQEGYSAYTSPLESGGLTGSLADQSTEFIRSELQAKSSRPQKIVEIGGFDGYTLSRLKDLSDSVLLIEPSVKGTEIANENGIAFERSLLDDRLIAKYANAFDVVISRHVIEHVGDPPEYVRQLASLLSPGGTLFIETPDLPTVLKMNLVRTVMLQHLHLFSPESLGRVLDDEGFSVRSMDYVSGRAVIVAAQRTSETGVLSSQRRAIDEANELLKLAEDFAERVQEHADRLTSLIESWKQANKRIWIWGAGSAAGELFNVYGQRESDFYGYIDSDAQKSGFTFPRSPQLVVHTPEEAFQKGVNAVLITSYSVAEISESITARGWQVEIGDIYSKFQAE